jgi:hypothetical protein
MPADVISLADRRASRRGDTIPAPPPALPACVLSARPGAVQMITGDWELHMDPAQARELGRELIELADDAEATSGR